MNWNLKCWIIFLWVLFIWINPSVGQEPERAPTDKKSAASEPASQSWALLVGINNYADPSIPDLRGAVNDVKLMVQLLTGKNGYGFPSENVFQLLNENATLAAFKKTFDSLASKAGKNDVVLIYFAGHGSRARDRNGDESDGWDETLIFHDSRTGDTPDLVDDVFHEMLLRLYQNTTNIVLVFDAAGSPTRGNNAIYQSRIVKEDPLRRSEKLPRATGEAGSWLPQTLKGAVFFSATGDYSPALETEEGGLFTRTLYGVWSKVGSEPMSYARSAHLIRHQIRGESYQIPYFEGDLEKWVLNNRSRRRPICWEILALSPNLEIGGPVLPGVGVNAEMRVYGEAAKPEDLQDPSKAKALLVVDRVTGFHALAHVDGATKSELEIGDLAILARPGDDATRIRVRIRPAGETDGIASSRAEKLKAAIRDHPETSMLVELNEQYGEYELIQNQQGRLQLLGPERRVRVTYESPPYREAVTVAANLWQHARIKAIMQLEGEGGLDYEDHQTIQVNIVPASTQKPDARGIWRQAKPNSLQPIPFQHAWNIRVAVDKDCPTPLLVGGLILSADGGMFGFPSDGALARVEPGQSYTFPDTFLATYPLNVEDHILVFGATEGNQVSWPLLTQEAATRGDSPHQSTLFRVLDRYLTPGSRGTRSLKKPMNSTWTLSSIALRVEPVSIK